MQKRRNAFYWLLALIVVLGAGLVSSCNTVNKTSKIQSTPRYNYSKARTKDEQKEVDFVIKEATSYLGTPYQYGGTSSKGMDCSGLVYTSYGKAGVDLPRSSSSMSQVGKKIRNKKRLKPGDLVFFSYGGRSINHVGMVTKHSGGSILFIHSSSSRGVVISDLKAEHYQERFVKATRVMD